MSDDYRILITGSRTWDDYTTIKQAIYAEWLTAREQGKRPILVSGHCPLGADKLAEEVWARNATGEAPVEMHPAQWRKPNGKKDGAAGFRRNAEMVALGADVCLAFIRDGSSGASHTAGLAEAAGIPTKRFLA